MIFWNWYHQDISMYVNRKQKFKHWAFLIGHNKLEYALFNCKFNFKLKTEFVNFN